MSYLESVDNALRLLLVLARNGEVGVTEAAAELGVAPSTAHRLLSTLCYRGFAMQGEDRAYRPGPAFALLDTGQGQRLDLVTLALPHMERLEREVDETCHLMVRVDRDVRFLASVESHQPLRVSSRAGSVMPAHLASGGKLLLADLAAEELDRLYPSAGVPALGMDAAAVQRLRGELRSARRRGYAVNLAQTERGIAAVAACIRDPQGRPAAAISVSAPTVRYSAARMPDLLRALGATAAAVTHELAK